MGLFKTLLKFFLCLSCLSVYSENTVIEKKVINKQQIPYLMQCNEIRRSIDLYQEYRKELARVYKIFAGDLHNLLASSELYFA